MRPPVNPTGEKTLGGGVGTSTAPGGQRKARKGRESSTMEGSPPTAASLAVAGTPLSLVGAVSTGEDDHIGQHECVQGSKGFKEQPSVTAGEAMPGNAGHLKQASSLPEAALQVFGILPVRSSCTDLVNDVNLVAGDTWEEGPKRVFRERTQFRATFSSSTTSLIQASPGSDSTARVPPASYNAHNIQSTGGPPVTHIAWDRHEVATYVLRTVPGLAVGADDQLASHRPADWAVRREDFQRFPKAGIAYSGELQAHNEPLWIANHTILEAGEDQREGERGGSGSGASNLTKTWPDSAQHVAVCPDFSTFQKPTEFASSELLLKEGEDGDGNLGFVSTGVCGAADQPLHGTTFGASSRGNAATRRRDVHFDGW